MNFPNNVPWYEFMRSTPAQTTKLPGIEVGKIFERAKKIYQRYVMERPIDEIQQSIIEKGTLKDKFNSYKVIAQDTPLLILEYLHKLNELMSGKPRVASDAMLCALSIYTKSILPPERTLKKFDTQQIKDVPDKHLLLYYFEDRVKAEYASFLQKTEAAARAQQEFLREPAIRALGEMIRYSPENDRVIINILVDKFGDPRANVSNYAGTTILGVLKDHPMMSESVTKILKQRMEKFNPPAKKRALKFIGQVKLSSTDKGAAKELLATVSEQLLEILNKNDQKDNKAIKSLMHSIEKCAEVCDTKDLEPLIPNLYTFIPTAPLSNGLPAIRLLFIIHKKMKNIPPKFYQFFFAFFSSPDFGSSSNHPQLLNLLLEVLTEETETSICCSFIQRLLQVGIHMSTTFSASVLFFCHKLLAIKPELRCMFTRVRPELERDYNYSETSPGSEASTVAFPWILALYTTHYHPAIREFAEALVNGREVKYESDTFADFSITNELLHIAGKKEEEDPEFVTNCYADFDEIPDLEDDEESEEDDLDVDQ